MLRRRLTAIVRREGEGYAALCPELDMSSQGETLEQALDHLREAIEQFFGTAPADEIERRLESDVLVTHVEVSLG